MKRLLIILFVILVPALAFAKQDFAEFQLKLHFVNATKDTSNIDLENNAIIQWVEEAQQQYSVKAEPTTYLYHREKKDA